MEFWAEWAELGRRVPLEVQEASELALAPQDTAIEESPAEADVAPPAGNDDDASPKKLPPLHPDHLADLRKSGINDDTIIEFGIYSARPQDISKLVGWDPPGVTSALVFPFHGEPDSTRIKPFPLLEYKDGRTAKYLQRKGSGVRLYVPLSANLQSN